MVNFLVEKGANIHAENDMALQWVYRNGYLEMAKFLVENGTNIHANHSTYRYLVKHGIIKS
mgnify:CR=1 FL=1